MIQFAQDLNSAIRYCRSVFDEQVQLFLLGHSLGAAIVLYHASRDFKLTGVISVASFADLKKVIADNFLVKHMPRFLIPLILQYMEWSVGDRFENLSPIHTISRISAPVLLLHGEQDKIVSVGQMKQIESATNSDELQIKIVAGADHSSILDHPETTKTILAFLRRCVTALNQ